MCTGTDPQPTRKVLGYDYHHALAPRLARAMPGLRNWTFKATIVPCSTAETHITQAVSFINFTPRISVSQMSYQTRNSHSLVRNFTEQNFQVLKNRETGHFSDPGCNPISLNGPTSLWRPHVNRMWTFAHKIFRSVAKDGRQATAHAQICQLFTSFAPRFALPREKKALTERLSRVILPISSWKSETVVIFYSAQGVRRLLNACKLPLKLSAGKMIWK